MRKILKIIAVLFFLAIWIGSFVFWWHVLQTTEHTLLEAVATFVFVVLFNIFFDTFLYGAFYLLQTTMKATDKIIDKLLE